MSFRILICQIRDGQFFAILPLGICTLSWRVIGCRCLLAGVSLAVAGNAECITLETSQVWLRMLVCHTALYREALFTVRVAGTVSVVATKSWQMSRALAKIYVSKNKSHVEAVDRYYDYLLNS